MVTLEPCHHTGRTGPCSQALIDAGVARVVFAQPDPNPVATGGEAALRAAGIQVEFGLMEREARALNRAWTFAMEHRRPFVTWKFATTLDGRSAAADGTSRWVTARAARVDSHRLRAQCDVMLVGTGTVETDDPELTVRDEYDEPLPHQPLRAVMGLRELDPGRRVLNDRAATVRLETRDPVAALALLHDRDRQHVFLEGGPQLAAAFLRAGARGRGRRLCGAGVPRCGHERRGRPRHHHHRRREKDADHRRDHRRRRRGGHRADHDEPRRGGFETLADARSSTSEGRRPRRGSDMFTGIVEELGTVEALKTRATRSGSPCAGRWSPATPPEATRSRSTAAA